MKKTHTRVGVKLLALVVAMVIAIPAVAGCATAPAGSAITIDATTASSVFDVQAGSTSDSVGEFVALIVALIVVAGFWTIVLTATNQV
jgi:hypothetical protein